MAATSTADVKLWLNLSDDVDDQLVDACVAAANAFVASIPYLNPPTVTPPIDPPVEPVVDPQTAQGATMLAARLYRRRNSPGGVEAYTDAAVYVARTDPDVALLLKLGPNKPPQVG